MTHFSDADGARGIAHQVAAFEAAHARPAGRAQPEQQRRHACATRRPRKVGADWVRAGIMSYGSAPDFPAHDIAHWQPAAGDDAARATDRGADRCSRATASATAAASSREAPLRIGVVACGYADGYPRLCATGTPVLVDGVRTRTVGRVSMDMITVDLTPVPEAAPGSEVTLWGRGPNGSVLAIDEVAASAGTIGYELMCALAPRVPVRRST